MAKGLGDYACMAALTNLGQDLADMVQIHNTLIGFSPLRLSDSLRSAKARPSPSNVFRTPPNHLRRRLNRLFHPDTPSLQPQPQPQPDMPYINDIELPATQAPSPTLPCPEKSIPGFCPTGTNKSERKHKHKTKTEGLYGCENNDDTIVTPHD